MIYSFDGYEPYVHPSAFVHDQATLIGWVEVGASVYIGPGAVLRGDWGRIQIADGCNVQENCVLHMFPGESVILEEAAHIGHGAIVHGAHLQRNVLIGMNAVVMDHALIGANSIVGALAFVPEGTDIEPNSLAVGNPVRVVKRLSQEQIDWKSKGTALYQQLPEWSRETLRACAPLREPKNYQAKHSELLKTWKSIKKNG